MKEKVINWFKNSQTWGFFLSVTIIAVLAVLFFYPDNMGGRTLHQADMAQGIANGQEGLAYQTETGEKALWTNSLFSGMPTFQISPSYPSNSLFAWINKLYGLFLPDPSNLLFMMMVGFLILLYCMGVRWWIALLGAIAWGFSSYYIIIIGAGHIWKFITLSYIPPTIGGLILCYRGRYVLGGALAALFAMMQLNANHPQMTYYFAFVVLGFVIVYAIELWRRDRMRQWTIASCVLVGAALLAVGANLPSLYNTYEYAKETKRAQSELAPMSINGEPAEKPTGGLPKSQIVGWSYGGSEMFSLLVPNIKGGASAKPVNGQMQMTGMSDVKGADKIPGDVAQTLPYFNQYFNDSEGTNGPVYVGAVICFLFLLGCFIVRGPMKWMLLTLTLLSMLLALGRNFGLLTDFMIYNFPMYSKFRAVESILVIAEFTMPLLAVLALAKVLSPKGEEGYWILEVETPSLDEMDDSTKPGYDVRTANALKKEAEEKAARALHRQGIFIIASFLFCLFWCLLMVINPNMFGSVINQNDIYVATQLEQYGIVPARVYNALETLRFGMVRADAWRSIFFLVVSFALVMMVQLRKEKGADYDEGRYTWVSLGLALLVTIDLFSIDKRYVSHESFTNAEANDGLPAELQADDIDNEILKDKDLSYRVLDIPGFGNAARSYRHKMIGGYHAAKLGRYDDLITRRMDAVRKIGFHPEFLDSSMVRELTMQYPDEMRELFADYRVLNMLNTRYIITGDQERPLLYNPYALGNGWFVDQISYVADANAEMNALETLNPATQAVADEKFIDVLGHDVVKPEPGDYIKLINYSPNTLVYDVYTKNGGLGVFSEVYFPWGWKAYIDNQPTQLGRVDYILRAMRIPAGKHVVEMTFDPNSIGVTSSIAYACVTLIYLWILLGLFAGYVHRRIQEDIQEEIEDEGDFGTL